MEVRNEILLVRAWPIDCMEDYPFFASRRRDIGWPALLMSWKSYEHAVLTFHCVVVNPDMTEVIPETWLEERAALSVERSASCNSPVATLATGSSGPDRFVCDSSSQAAHLRLSCGSVPTIENSGSGMRMI
jgi:hypothetical protein